MENETTMKCAIYARVSDGRIGNRACWCCGAKWRSGCVIGPECKCDGTPVSAMCLRCGKCPEHCECTPEELRAHAELAADAGDNDWAERLRNQAKAKATT